VLSKQSQPVSRMICDPICRGTLAENAFQLNSFIVLNRFLLRMPWPQSARNGC